MTGFQRAPPVEKHSPWLFFVLFVVWAFMMIGMIALPGLVYPSDSVTPIYNTTAPLDSLTLLATPTLLDDRSTASPSTPIVTLIPNVVPPPTEDLRGKEIERPFDGTAFDWSFGVLPLLRRREFFSRFLTWLRLW